MFTHLLKTLSAAVLLLAATGCDNTPKCLITCNPEDIYVSISGYNYYDLDTIVVHTYRPGNNSTPSATEYIYNTSIGWGDRAVLDKQFYNSYNYLICIPKTNDSFMISDVQRKGPQSVFDYCDAGVTCVNYVDYYMLNGQKQSGAEVKLTP